MTVNDWFQNGCNYQHGILVYESLESHNKNYVKIFRKKETPENLMKLKYELQKFIAPTISKPTENKPIGLFIKKEIEKVVETPATTSIFLRAEKQEETKYYRKLLLHQLPVELHPLYIQQKNDFNTYCSLKLQLNALNQVRDTFGNIVLDAKGLPKRKPQTDADIEKARLLCMQIETLFDAIDKTWEVLDHYLATKEIVIIQQKSFDELTPGKVRDKLISVRGSLTRQNQRLQKLQESLKHSVTKSFQIKYERDIAKSKGKIMQLEQDLIKLIQIRDGEK